MSRGSFPHAALGPQLAVPILWAPGISGCILAGKTHDAYAKLKNPRFRGGGRRARVQSGFFEKGGVGSANVNLLWAPGRFAFRYLAGIFGKFFIKNDCLPMSFVDF